MTRSISMSVALATLFASCALASAAAGPNGAGSSAAGPAVRSGDAAPVPADRVVQHVTRTIAWYRRMGALQQLPVDADDVVPRERLGKTALTAMQLAFEFGHAAAILQARAAAAPASASQGAPPSGSAPPPDAAGNAGQASAADGQSAELDRVAARLADRVTALQSQLSDVEQRLAHASSKERDTLSAQRAELAAALDLSKEVQSTVDQLQRFEENADTDAGGSANGLASQIAELERSVPEARRGANAHPGGGTGSGTGGASAAAAPASAAATSAVTPAAAASTAAASAAAAAFRPESAGVITLIGKWFSLEGTRRQLNDAVKLTDTMSRELDTLRADLSQDARVLARQDLASANLDPAQLAQARQQFDAAASRFRQLSTLLLPIGEQGISVTSARNTLTDWRESLESRNSAVVRFLLLRLGILLGSIAVVLFVSEIWRRATFRYLHDARRRQQFLSLRRVAVGAALTLVIVFGLVSEVGSLATYAGLITAGLAVALQNVILAVVAYFFLIGRYGVRVGDHITLAGVTGRVVEIGLVRIYLMELTGSQLRPSGRMVVLSNAVLFQPTALFKQMPGGDYYWHTLTLTLAGTADVGNAEKQLAAVAESVYEKYRGTIEQQHAALQRFIDFETAMPRPEVYARLTVKGLECTMRYPVDPTQAAATDQRMLAALREALSAAPELQLVDGPTLETPERA